MAFSMLPLAGIDFTKVYPVGTQADFTIGNVVIGNTGLLHVFGQANASISASTAVCTVNATSFLVTASGGAYTSPATALVSGDKAWFSKALV